jgi:hypothetical protein
LLLLLSNYKAWVASLFFGGGDGDNYKQISFHLVAVR